MSQKIAIIAASYLGVAALAYTLGRQKGKEEAAETFGSHLGIEALAYIAAYDIMKGRM